MKLLNEAYGVLKDERIRRDYDARRHPNRPTSFTPYRDPPRQRLERSDTYSAPSVLARRAVLLCWCGSNEIWFLGRSPSFLCGNLFVCYARSATMAFELRYCRQSLRGHTVLPRGAVLDSGTEQWLRCLYIARGGRMRDSACTMNVTGLSYSSRR